MGLFIEVCDAVGEPWADDAFFLYALLAKAGGYGGALIWKWETLMAHRTRWPTPRDLERPSRMVRRWRKAGIIDMKLKELRINQRARIGGALAYWAETKLDVGDPSLTSPAPLLAIPGVGPETARLFLLYRRITLEKD